MRVGLGDGFPLSFEFSFVFTKAVSSSVGQLCDGPSLLFTPPLDVCFVCIGDATGRVLASGLVTGGFGTDSSAGRRPSFGLSATTDPSRIFAGLHEDQ